MAQFSCGVCAKAEAENSKSAALPVALASEAIAATRTAGTMKRMGILPRATDAGQFVSGILFPRKQKILDDRESGNI
jgi:hypothetical protein